MFGFLHFEFFSGFCKGTNPTMWLQTHQEGPSTSVWQVFGLVLEWTLLFWWPCYQKSCGIFQLSIFCAHLCWCEVEIFTVHGLFSSITSTKMTVIPTGRTLNKSFTWICCSAGPITTTAVWFFSSQFSAPISVGVEDQLKFSLLMGCSLELPAKI